MVLEDPEPSFEERWRRRALALAAVVGIFFLLMAVQFHLLSRNLWAGLGLAPLVHFGGFQLASRVVTGRLFAVRLRPDATRPEEVFDVLFTVGFLLALLVGCYSVYDASQAPPPPPKVL